MPSPFPGMDPYLEGYLWPDVHHRLATQISRQLAPQIQPNYVARLEISVIEDTTFTAEVGVMYPDVEVLKVKPASPALPSSTGEIANGTKDNRIEIREGKMQGTLQAKQDLTRLLNKLITGYTPQRVILFGSYAYGKPDQHSDLDLLIIKETNKSPFQRRIEVGRIVRDQSRMTPIQPLVITPQELKEQLQKGNPFLIEILQKGEVLYDADRVKAAG